MPSFANYILNSRPDFAYANRFTANLGGIYIPPEQLESVSLPGLGINTFEAPIGGWSYESKVPGGLVFEDITLVIRETNDFTLYKAFEEWMAKIITPEYKLNYLEDYARPSVITQLDKAGNSKYNRYLENSFPTGINNIELSAGSENTITTFSVTITYT